MRPAISFTMYLTDRNRHWKTNEAVSVDRHHGDLEYSHQTSRFYRARLQQALLAHVEPGTIHLRKAFKSVSSSLDTDELLITFEDGSETVADVLLGADGIQSAVRRFFIPTSAPKWIGWVAFRSVFGAKLVEHIPGVLDEAYHWWGPDRTFFSSRLGKNLFTIVGGNYTDPNAPDAPWKDATWNSDGDLGVLKSYYKDWHPMIRQMIDASRYVRMYSNTFASSLETWVHGDGRVTFPETRHMLMEERLLLEDRWPWTMHGRFLGLYSRPSHRTLQSHQEVPSTKPCGFMKQQESHTSIEFSLLYIRIMRLRYSD